MPVTNSATHFRPRTGPWARGPEVTFAAAVLIVVTALAACWRTLPSDLVLPVISTLLFVLASLVALAALCWERASQRSETTYWDVAGALTFIGVCVASQIDPDQMVRLVEGAPREH
jgi:uncharacterized membrane protein YhaH (DUF805 family)